MRISAILTIASLLAITPASLFAQGSTHNGNDLPRFDASAGFEHIQANAPPGLCQCFGTNGGYASLNWRVFRRIGIEGEFTGSHDSNVSSLGQNLTLTTFLAGPHITVPIHRVVPFYEVLVGGAHGSDSYFPSGNTFTTTASSFAFAPGGGIDYDLSDRYSIRLVQARYLHTSFPNGTTNEQHHLMIGAGIVIHLGHVSRWVSSAKAAPDVPPPPAPVAATPPPPPPPVVSNLQCTSAISDVQAGSPLQVAAIAQSSGAGTIAYSWRVSGGQVLGSGERITVHTASLPPGEYHVTGHAQLGDDARSGRDCDVLFHVIAPPPPPPAVVTPERVADFKAHVHDIYFDLNKWNLRPDAERTLREDATYLTAHPEIRFQIGGFADQRGGSQFNLALGEKRANTVKAALIAQGVAEDRIEIVTFGRDAQSCTAGTEKCWQQNRRVGFVMQP